MPHESLRSVFPSLSFSCPLESFPDRGTFAKLHPRSYMLQTNRCTPTYASGDIFPHAQTVPPVLRFRHNMCTVYACKCLEIYHARVVCGPHCATSTSEDINRILVFLTVSCPGQPYRREPRFSLSKRGLFFVARCHGKKLQFPIHRFEREMGESLRRPDLSSWSNNTFDNFL